MAVQGQPVSVYAGLPIDESTRREASSVGKSNRANGNVRQDDRLALRKRPGFTPLPTTRNGGASARSAGRKLFAHQGAPCVIDGAFLDCYLEQYSSGSPTGASANIGRVPEFTYRIQPVPSVGISGFSFGDCVNGIAAYTAGLTLIAVDVATGVQQARVTLPAAASFVTSVGSRFLVAYVIASPTRIYLLDTQSIATGWTSINVTGSTAVTGQACCALTDTFAAAWMTGAGSTVNVATFSVSGATIATTTVSASGVGAADVGMSLSFAGGKLWLAFSDLPNPLATKVVAFDPTSLTVVSTLITATTLTGGLPIISAAPDGSARVMSVAAASVRIVGLTTSAGATVAATPYTLTGVRAAGRAFNMNGRHYVATYAGLSTASTNAQGLCTLVDWTDDATALRPVAHIEPGLVSSFMGLTQDAANGKAYLLVSCFTRVAAKFSGAGDQSVTNLNVIELSSASLARWQTTECGSATFLSGAVLSVFDGAVVTEAGFCAAPGRPNTALSGTGITGTYAYVAIYEDVDAAGNVVASGVSLPSTNATPANQAVTVSVPPLTVTSRAAKGTLRVAFYRTLTGGNAPYYRLGTTVNDITAATVTFADTVPDATLSSRGKLYAPNLPGTAGESLDRRAPPGLVDVANYLGLLVGIKGQSVLYSGQPVYGEATWFNPVFEVPVTGGGDFVALAPIDGSLYLFKADRIFAVSGDVPSDNGLQGGLGQPRLLASDVGCIDANSVVATSLGVFFRSSRGIELLAAGGSGSVQFIGDSVYRTVDAYPVTTSAVLDERNGLVRFSLAAAQALGVVSSGGVDLVFDLTLQTWVSTDTFTGATSVEASQCSTVVRNRGDYRYARLGANGVVYVEKDLTDADACLDGSIWVQSTWELPPWNLALQREQVSFGAMTLFERAGAAGLVIEEADDYAAAYTGFVHTWTETETLGQNQLELRPKIRGSAVQLRVRDTAPAVLGSGKGITFVGMTFDIGANQGPNKASPRASSTLRK